MLVTVEICWLPWRHAGYHGDILVNMETFNTTVGEINSVTEVQWRVTRSLFRESQGEEELE